MNCIARAHQGITWIGRSLPRVKGVNALGRRFSSVMSGIGGDFTGPIRMRDGTRLILDTRSRTELGAFWTGDYEVPAIRFIKKQFPRGGTFIDVGANIGFVTIAIANHLRPKHGKVFAFEPVATNFNRLAENIALNKLNGTVQSFNIGLGDADCQAFICLQSETDDITGNAVLSNAVLPSDVPGRQSVVMIKRLDDVLNQINIGDPCFVKVDIEGAEMSFLHGAKQFIERYRPIVFGEFNRDFIKRLGHSVVDAERFFKPLGYKACRLTKKIEKYESLSVGMQDIVFVPNEGSLVD